MFLLEKEFHIWQFHNVNIRNESVSSGDEVQPKLVLVGGFLGAGKTTLIGRMIGELAEVGITSGVVTNDQAEGLVDTSSMRAAGAESIAEVAGGCFCCRLDQLVGVLEEKWGEGASGEERPGVVIAEPVGSCTDLMSTVLMPLSKIYQVPFALSPLSVVVDARRVLSSLGGKRIPGDFSKNVGYIYLKQLEEAEIIVVNKADLMSEEDLNDLNRRLSKHYPEKPVYILSAKTGSGVKEWLSAVLELSTSPKELMEVDYQVYGEGEALLGWVNAEVALEAVEETDGDEWLAALANEISDGLARGSSEVAHFKMALKGPEGRLGTINQVISGVAPEISRPFSSSFRNAVLTVNLRAEDDPDSLLDIVEKSLAAIGPRMAVGHRIKNQAAFRPGQPVPTAKVTAL